MGIHDAETDYHGWKQILRDAGLRDGRSHDARVLLNLQAWRPGAST
ncbi:hypothetical protein ACIBSW_06365 [Actinoplanes sp. NPDC049668]